MRMREGGGRFTMREAPHPSLAMVEFYINNYSLPTMFGGE
jgi:hypothetical protein